MFVTFSPLCRFRAISFVSFDLQYSNFIYMLLMEGGAWDCFWVYTWIEDGSSDSRFSKLVDVLEKIYLWPEAMLEFLTIHKYFQNLGIKKSNLTCGRRLCSNV
jgi:hypothetical protein